MRITWSATARILAEFKKARSIGGDALFLETEDFLNFTWKNGTFLGSAPSHLLGLLEKNMEINNNMSHYKRIFSNYAYHPRFRMFKIREKDFWEIFMYSFVTMLTNPPPLPSLAIFFKKSSLLGKSAPPPL